jgi:hypothetical protein
MVVTIVEEGAAGCTGAEFCGVGGAAAVSGVC